MKLAFVVDPLPALKAYKDSSIAMMRAASRRGHRIHAFEQSDLLWRGGKATASATPLTVHADHTHWHDAGTAAVQPLEAFDAVVMRKDPPFDMEYVYSTYLLELAEGRIDPRSNLMHDLRRLALKDTDLEKAQCTTIRLKLLKIGSQIHVSVRRVWLRMAAGYPYKEAFQQAFDNLQRIPLRC